MYRQPAAVLLFRTVVQLLKSLHVHHAHQIVKRLVVDRRDNKDRALAFAKGCEIHLIRTCDVLHLVQQEIRQTGRRHLPDRVARLFRAGKERLIILHGNMVLALFFFQLQEQLVCRAFHAVPSSLRIIQQIHNGCKVFIFLFAFMVEVQDQRRDQRRLCFLPEWVAAMRVFRRRVPYQQRHEPDHICV